MINYILVAIISAHFLDGVLPWLDARVKKIVFILVVTLGAKFLMDLVSFLNERIILSDKGLLKYIARNRQKGITLNKIFINLVKYVVYFAAFGYILKELGVSVDKYLAGLGIIGLAVAFGSQGLVQDVVSGFFIIFENQFNVGDMVEIAGQTGIVEDMGLRAIRIRNYFHEKIIIPNRNIAMVGNFTLGHVRAFVDISIKDDDRVLTVLKKVGGDLRKQYDGVVLADPQILGIHKLSAEDIYARMRVDIWPGQQWVVERELADKIRTAFSAQGLEILNDKISIFYRARETQKSRQMAFDRVWGRLAKGDDKSKN